MIKLAVFDGDGTLWDNQAQCIRAMGGLYEHIGVPDPYVTAGLTWYTSHFGHPAAELKKAGKPHVGRVLKTFNYKTLGLLMNIRTEAMSDVQLFPGMAGVVERLSVPYVIASNNKAKTISRTVRALGLPPPEKVYSGGKRPKSHKLREILLEHDLYPDECRLITDTHGDVLEARTIGMPAIGFAPGLHSPGDLYLAQPLAVVRSAEELLQYLPSVDR